MAFILFDAHNFYVSAQLVWQPEFIGKPVVVIGSNDGCVISRSPEAKKLGIAMGEPAHFVREEFWRENVKFFSANFALYGDMSSRMMAVIEQLVPKMRIYSIDEAFAICDGMSIVQLETLASQVQAQVKQWTGLGIGAGIAGTLTLAKVSSYLAKRVFKTDMHSIHSDADRIEAISRTPVAEVWGVGPAYASKLESLGVRTALELAQASTSMIRQNFPVGIWRTQAELQGFPAVDLGDESAPRQMINVGRSFGQRIESLHDLKPAFAAFAMKAAEKLNKQRSVCGAIRAYLRPAGDQPVRPVAVTAKLSIRTSDPRAIAVASAECATRMFRQGVAYSKGGICLLDLDQPEAAIQPSLFDTCDQDGGRISTLMAQINARFGRGSLSVASTLGPDVWKPRADGISDTYSTRISELKVVN
ncbi:DUF4113 domain-containing protein [Pseudomonas aeruginosa]|uniref:Y-family DNA polymerase n=1 Tax=Pseudomonas aeruginosa TaxID=287 RepID=UPI00104B73C8|nr:DUF4113 domain-containing protein [Pseudomonas aeruginosa]